MPNGGNKPSDRRGGRTPTTDSKPKKEKILGGWFKKKKKEGEGGKPPATETVEEGGGKGGKGHALDSGKGGGAKEPRTPKENEEEPSMDKSERMIEFDANARHKSMKRGSNKNPKNSRRVPRKQVTDEKKKMDPAKESKKKDSNSDANKKKKRKEEEYDPTPFFKYIEEKGWKAIEEEFNVNLKANCTEFNRDTRYAITLNVPPDEDFYDANKVEMAGNEVKFLACSAPPKGNVTGIENFWRLVYDSNATNIFMLEDLGAEKSDMLPHEPGSSKDYGKMQIMNKKATNSDRGNQTVLEVLPHGCSNSVITRFIQVRAFPDDMDHTMRRLALHHVRLLKDEKGLTIVMCRTGTSRTAVFILLYWAIARITKNEPVNMPELLETIRSARWGAVPKVEHYILVYNLVLDYIQCKLRGKHEKKASELLKSQSAHRRGSTSPTISPPVTPSPTTDGGGGGPTPGGFGSTWGSTTGGGAGLNY